ncbi:MAG: acyltransferase family protein [Mycobacterium leprae]
MTLLDAPAKQPEPAAPPPPSQAWRFRPDIEGLRGIAVLAVVLYHASLAVIPGGYVGVDVFFVISGFLITGHLLAEVQATGRISLPKFYARRARRLLPAASLVAVVTVALSWLLQSALAAKSTAVDAMWTSFFGMNIKLASEGANYLSAEKAPSLLQHYWSLAVEEQYYLVWPLLMLLVALAFRTRRRSLPTGLAAVLTVVVAASLAASVWQTNVAQPWAYFGLHARACELALGALVAVLASRAVRIPEACGWVGLGMLVAAITLFTEHTRFPGYAVALPVVGTALVILSGCGPRETALQRVLGRWPLDGIGRVSYGWYLWHWPLLTLVPLFIHRERSLEVDLFSVLVGLLLAVVTLQVVENPVRFARALAPPARSLAMGTGLSVSVAGVAVGILALPAAVATVRRSRSTTPRRRSRRSCRSRSPQPPRRATSRHPWTRRRRTCRRRTPTGVTCRSPPPRRAAPVRTAP